MNRFRPSLAKDAFTEFPAYLNDSPLGMRTRSIPSPARLPVGEIGTIYSLAAGTLQPIADRALFEPKLQRGLAKTHSRTDRLDCSAATLDNRTFLLMSAWSKSHNLKASCPTNAETRMSN